MDELKAKWVRFPGDCDGFRQPCWCAELSDCILVVEKNGKRWDITVRHVRAKGLLGAMLKAEQAATEDTE